MIDSAPILPRRASTWVSSVFVEPIQSVSQTSRMIRSRVTTRPASESSSASSSNSLGRRPSSRRPDARAGGEVHDEVARRERAHLGERARGCAPLVRAHAGEELGEPERLDEVVVGARVEPRDDVELLVARGEDENREIRPARPQPPTDGDAVDVGQAEIEDDEPDPVGRLGDRRPAARDPHHRVPLAVEHPHEPRGDRVVVLDEQDAVAAHRSSVRAPPGPIAQL